MKLRVERELAETLVRSPGSAVDPMSLARALRDHANCEAERRYLMEVVERAGRDYLTLQHEYRALRERFDSLLQENAALVAERRRLEESLLDVRRRSRKG